MSDKSYVPGIHAPPDCVPSPPGAQPEQQPLGWIAFMATDKGTIFHRSRIMTTELSAQVCAGQWSGFGGSQTGTLAIYAEPVPAADIVALVESLRAMWGWAIELPSMAEFASWDDATKADFFLAMRKAEDLLKNYPRKA